MDGVGAGVESTRTNRTVGALPRAPASRPPATRRPTMRYTSVLSANYFAAGAVAVAVVNSPAATVIVASQVGNTVAFGGGLAFGFGPLALDERGLPGL